MSEDGTLEARLRQAERARGDSYDKRTEHLNEDGSGRFINRLILEDSPYLLQHAHNPVNWYAWGDEAFAAAREADKPVFLSIGYSTCHWCHVMEVESFDNTRVAQVLNKDFISIKMDREQYPDVDEIYMTGVQLVSGQGGWPMSNFLLPDGRPFFAATYFPPPSFLKLLQQIASGWEERRQEFEASAERLDTAIRRILGEQRAADRLADGLGDECVHAILERQDEKHGGLAGAPKFPQEPLLLFMLDRATREGDARAGQFVEVALGQMAQGGIYDQVAGGFHRYSVDQYWLVPHFEKMLYNQSQLGLVLLQAWRLSGRADFRRVLTQTFDYVLRDLQHPDGGFYSATDADSEGAEGCFFLWTREQLEDVLGASEGAWFAALYGVEEGGNFEGSNILHLEQPLETLAEARTEEDLVARVQDSLDKLYTARERREHPLRDEKLIVAWNGTMITALCWGGYYLGREDYIEAARRAADSLWESNRDEDGELKRIRLGGTVSIRAQLEDYGNLAEALLALFDVLREERYLQRAAQLMAACDERFRDAQQDRLYVSPASQDGPVLARSLSAADSATLSPVATALSCWQRLGERAALLTDWRRDEHGRIVDGLLSTLAAQINEQALAHTSLLRLLAERQDGAVQAIRYAGEGRIRIETRAEHLEQGSIALTLSLSLVSGWRLSASDDQTEGLSGPNLRLAESSSGNWRLETSELPDSAVRQDVGAKKSVSVYEDELRIEAELVPSGNGEPDRAPIGLLLSLQLCSEQHCALPEELRLILPLGEVRNRCAE